MALLQVAAYDYRYRAINLSAIHAYQRLANIIQRMAVGDNGNEQR